MIFETPRCPDCGGLARGMCEILTGVALLNFDKSEEKGAAEAEYDGYTDVDWNSQRPDRDESGRALLECHEGHRWYSEQS